MFKSRSEDCSYYREDVYELPWVAAPLTKLRPRRCVGVNETRPPLAIVPPQARQRPSERKRERC